MSRAYMRRNTALGSSDTSRAGLSARRSASLSAAANVPGEKSSGFRPISNTKGVIRSCVNGHNASAASSNVALSFFISSGLYREGER